MFSLVFLLPFPPLSRQSISSALRPFPLYYRARDALITCSPAGGQKIWEGKERNKRRGREESRAGGEMKTENERRSRHNFFFFFSRFEVVRVISLGAQQFRSFFFFPPDKLAHYRTCYFFFFFSSSPLFRENEGGLKTFLAIKGTAHRGEGGKSLTNWST